jgi:arylformamidase
VLQPLVALIVSIGLAFGKWTEARSRMPAPPRPVTLPYGTDPAQAIDFWAATQQSAPLIVFVHGGAWSGGSKASATGRAKILHCLERDLAFATIGYRLIPHARIEDQAGDVARALARLIAGAHRLGFDRRRVVLTGHSAGAHLVALIGTEPRWLRDVGLSFDHIAGIVAIDGAAFDVPQQIADAPLPMRPLYTQAFGSDPARQRALSPFWQAAAPNVVNWLLLHIDRPDGRRQSQALAAALRRAGSTVDVLTIPGAGFTGHVAANRRMGDPTYPGTALADQWIDRLLASRVT